MSTVMSDASVIEMFVGNYEQKDEDKIENSDPNKLLYYPRNGVRLTIEKVLLLNGKNEEAYAKMRISNGETFTAKLASERAVFRVVGETLVATDMELSPGSLITETLTMTKNDGKGHKEMLHSLKFSDGQHGTWICKS
jgi:hypothetical protein